MLHMKRVNGKWINMKTAEANNMPLTGSVKFSPYTREQLDERRKREIMELQIEFNKRIERQFFEKHIQTIGRGNCSQEAI